MILLPPFQGRGSELADQGFSCIFLVWCQAASVAPLSFGLHVCQMGMRFML